MESDSAKIKKYNQAYKKWLAQVQGGYEYDNSECSSFAHVLYRQAEAEGYNAYKVCTFGSEREAYQKVSALRPLADGSGFAKAEWDYHMACAIDVPVYKDSERREVLVADPVLFGDNLVTLKQWAAALDTPLPQVTIQKQDFYANAPSDVDTRAATRIQALRDVIKKQEAEPDTVQKHSNCKLNKFRPLKSMLLSNGAKEVSVRR